MTIGVLYGAYSWAYERGVASQAETIATLTRERDEALVEVSIAAKNATAQNEAHERSLSIAKAETAATMALLRTNLDRSELTVKKLKEKLSAIVPTYITQKADASCVITAGFVRLHNLSAAGLDPTEPTQDPSTTGSGSENADTPTSLKASTLGATVSENYLECKARLDVIEAWQTWYTRSKATIDKAIQEQNNYIRLVAPN